MVTAAAAAAATWLAPRTGYPKGFSATTPRKLNWGTKERRCIRRNSGAVRVSAAFELKPLPYPLDGLVPHMSADTLESHWGKHHRAYVENLNKQIAETDFDGMSLEDVVIATYNKGDMLPAFNNAAQVWNHDFFWESIKPGGGGKPSGELLRLIERDFGSFEEFVERFKSAAATQFGSGWAWLVYKANKLNVDNAVNPRPSEDDNKLVVVKSPNAVNPLVWDYSPLLTIDVWEHAYYLDFQNRRPDYLSTFLEKLVSWETVSARLEAAKARAAAREMEEERKKQEQEVDDGGDNAEQKEDLPTMLDNDDSDDSDDSGN